MLRNSKPGTEARPWAWGLVFVGPLLILGLVLLLGGCGAKPGATKKGAKPSATLSEEAAQLIKENRLEELKKLLKAHPRLLDYSPGPDGTIPAGPTNLLIYAVAVDRPAALNLMLDFEPDLTGNMAPHTGTLESHLLFLTVVGDKIRMVRMLLDHGVDVKRIDTTGSVLLGLKEGQESLLRELIQAGADVNRHSDQNGTPLVYAAQGGRWGIGGALLDAGADPNAQNDRKERAIHFTVRRGRSKAAMEFLRLLVAKGADVNAPLLRGDTPLHECVTLEAMEILLDAGADPNAKGERGNTPLHLSRKRRDPAFAQLLTAKGADPTLKNDRGEAAGDVATPEPVQRLDPAATVEKARKAREAMRVQRQP